MMKNDLRKEYVLQEAQKFVFVKPGVNVSIMTLRRYHSDGTRAVMLAGAGTIHGLITYSIN